MLVGAEAGIREGGREGGIWTENRGMGSGVGVGGGVRQNERDGDGGSKASEGGKGRSTRD
jgi:hypothetical protein